MDLYRVYLLSVVDHFAALNLIHIANGYGREGNFQYGRCMRGDAYNNRGTIPFIVYVCYQLTGQQEGHHKSNQEERSAGDKCIYYRPEIVHLLPFP